MSSQLADRDVTRWKRRVYWHGAAGNFLQEKEFRTGVHSFQDAGLFFDLLVENNGSDTTAFFFHSAIEREGKKLPFFTGNNVLSGGSVNRVFVSDPSLLMSNTIRLAWFAGVSRGVRVQDRLLEAISHLNQRLNAKKTIFMGPSNGGFAALYFSWFFPNSIAYAMNPQTRIPDFTMSAVEAFAAACLGAGDQVTVDAALQRTNHEVRSLYAKSFDNHVVYVQNDTDHHVHLQMEPFLKVAKKRVHLIIDHFGDGHKAPPVEHTAATLGRIALIRPDDVNPSNIDLAIAGRYQ